MIRQGKGVTGTLPPDLGKLSELIVLEFFSNKISGPIPNLSGLTHLQTLNLRDNLFDSTPKNLFSGMNSLQEVYLNNNPFPAWEIPETVKETTSLKNLSLINCNIRQGKGVTGTLPPDLGKLSELIVLEFFSNKISGPIPNLSGLTHLQTLNLRDNLFDSTPKNLFSGMNSLQEVYLDNNPFPAWEIPETVKETTSLKNLSLINCNVTGSIPNFFKKN
ncbi:Leucine-rich repeat protein kinase family protein [Raphanus sativus]|nr:Leucine-rich repeat protein kinase family protein [Raphanus sativus]